MPTAHGLRKHAIVALRKMRSPAALKTLRNIDRYVGKHPLCCERLQGSLAEAIKDLSKKDLL